MKKAIAMKCTREQFDAVKEKIPKERIKDLYNLDSLDCITNIYDDVNGISNIAYGNGKYKGLVIHKTWNEEIFLNACGIETEMIFKGSKMKEEAQRILDLFNGDYVLGLRCINELIRETGAKYWYDVRREYEQE